MGVDASFYCLYGVELDNTFYESSTQYLGDKIFGKVDGYLSYNYNKCELRDFPLRVINEPYGGEWSVVGFEILSSKPEEVIQALKEAQEKWHIVKEQLESVLDEAPEPSVIYGAYFS